MRRRIAWVLVGAVLVAAGREAWWWVQVQRDEDALRRWRFANGWGGWLDAGWATPPRRGEES